MLDELRHSLLEDEIETSALACDCDMPREATELECRWSTDRACEPDDVGEDDVDPSIR
jgi:hypothetical protein